MKKVILFFLVGCHSLPAETYNITEIKADKTSLHLHSCYQEIEKQKVPGVFVFIHHSYYVNGFFGRDGLTCDKNKAIRFSSKAEADLFIFRLGNIQNSKDPSDKYTTAYAYGE